jgi:ABC-type Fe3+ transport system permease subunit
MSSVGGGTPITGDATMRQALSQSATVPRRRRSLGTIVWWVIFLAGVAYFVIPLWSTFMFSLQAEPFGAAYTNTLDDPQFGSTLLYSFVVGVITVIVSIAIMVPTAFWVRLRVPRLRRIVEFVTLLPFVIPPVLLVFGLIRSYSSGPLPLTNTDIGSSALLVAAYTVLSFPYMYRAVDVGLRSIDVQSLTEASQSWRGSAREASPSSCDGSRPWAWPRPRSPSSPRSRLGTANGSSWTAPSRRSTPCTATDVGSSRRS